MKALKKLSLIGISALLLSGAQLNCFAQDKTEIPSVAVAETKDMLQLTPEQKTKMKDLKVAKMKETLPIKNQLGEKKAHLRTLSTSAKPDMIEINKTIDEIGALHTQLMKKNAAHQQEVRKILTDDQRIIFDLRMSMEKKSMKHKKTGKPHCENMNEE
ncbi:MAG: periplasmic heavy metal sensor [Bacteroidales bacterium]|nr:periplasmic heavy metal sensor [Bacteroidales bacterium]